VAAASGSALDSLSCGKRYGEQSRVVNVDDVRLHPYKLTAIGGSEVTLCSVKEIPALAVVVADPPVCVELQTLKVLVGTFLETF